MEYIVFLFARKGILMSENAIKCRIKGENIPISTLIGKFLYILLLKCVQIVKNIL